MLMLIPMMASAQFAKPTDDQRAGLAQEASLSGAFIRVLEFLTGLLAILAILAIVISGIYYITSGGDGGRVDTAKGWLTYAIIGLVVALLAWVIVTAVSEGLGAGDGGGGDGANWPDFVGP